MRIKFSGRSINFRKGSGDIVEIVADLHADEISTELDSDGVGEFTHIYVRGKGSIVVERDTLKCDIV